MIILYDVLSAKAKHINVPELAHETSGGAGISADTISRKLVIIKFQTENGLVTRKFRF